MSLGEGTLVCGTCPGPSHVPGPSELPLPFPLQNHLPDCLPPRPRAGSCQASLYLLPWLEEDRQAPWGLCDR